MQLLNKYVSFTIVRFVLLVLVIVLGMELFISLVAEFGDMGHGDYGIGHAFAYCLLSLPVNLYQLFPMVGLLGCLIGLGLLGQYNELLIMRAAGMHIFTIVRIVMQVALILIVVVTLLGETLAPSLEAYANRMKIAASSGGQAIGIAHGLWLRNDSRFIYLGDVMSNSLIKNVVQYEFDKQHKLQDALHAEEAIRKDGHWYLENVKQSVISAQGVQQKVIPRMLWPVPLAKQLAGSEQDLAANMSLWTLYDYIQLQHKVGMSTRMLSLNFWQRIVQPFSALVMIFLAVPFIFGPLRSVTMGVRIVTGAAVGFSFYLLNQFFGPLSMVYQLPPILGAAIPTVLFAILGLWLLKRVR